MLPWMTKPVDGWLGKHAGAVFPSRHYAFRACPPPRVFQGTPGLNSLKVKCLKAVLRWMSGSLAYLLRVSSDKMDVVVVEVERLLHLLSGSVLPLSLFEVPHPNIHPPLSLCRIQHDFLLHRPGLVCHLTLASPRLPPHCRRSGKQQGRSSIQTRAPKPWVRCIRPTGRCHGRPCFCPS